jgi:putative heme-binding domain-containing protein
MKSTGSAVRRHLSLLAAVGLVGAGWAQEAGKNPTAVAGSEQALEIIRSYPGRGALADGSKPTPAEEAMKTFKLREGFALDLVASEPAVEQSLFLTWDGKGRLWAVLYRQYQFPAGLKIVEYDNHLRARFDKVPLPPPHGDKGEDLIRVFEDTDGDGRYDSHKDVITGLNIATSVAVGAGGIWVANPPYLLFYPDANADDVPDSDPVVKLSGFGIEDTHSVMNSLAWGPDGWLYGANGSTTTGKVVDPATGKTVAWQGQMIWRFDPKTDRFEIFAEGGGNTFSLEIDGKGRIFSGTNGGKTRGMFYPQGSYGSKSWGKHGPLTNPYAFGFFEHMKHEGDERRFPQTFTICEGGLFGPELEGHIVAANSLHNVVWSSRIERDGSTYRTIDEANPVESPDRWFRPVFAGMGPDGAVYFADWYDSRLSHVRPVDDWHKTSGRIYRLHPSGKTPVYREGDLGKLPSEELVALFDHPNRLVRRRAVLELGWRGDQSVGDGLVAKVDAAEGQASLEALWALNLLGGLSDERAAKWLTHPDADVRRWVVRLVGDRRAAEGSLVTGLADLALSETDVQVRVQLAASAKRLPPVAALGIVDGLVHHDEDATDPHQPLMIWWAVEAQAESGRKEVEDWLSNPETWKRPLVRDVVLERLMKRYAIAGGAENHASAAFLLAKAPDDPIRTKLIEALQSSFEGVTMPTLPEPLSKALQEYSRSLGDSGLVLRLRSGEKGALDEAKKAVLDPKLPSGVRTELVRLLGESGEISVIDPLLKILSFDQEYALKRVALQTLARFEEESVAKGIIGRYGSTLPSEHGVRSTAERVLAGRLAWARLMMDEVEKAVIKDRDLGADIVQLMMEHKDADLNARIQKHWPGIAAGAGGIDLAAESARLKQILGGGAGEATSGKAIFTARCATCHQLFGEGMTIGPDLTGYERQNLDFWLPSILNPSLELREGYLNYVASMKDGRKVIGILTAQDPRTVTLKDLAGQVSLLDRTTIDRLEASPISLMPPGLLMGLGDSELRDFFAYLMKEPK